MTSQKIEYRRAIEALRSGVPNRDAVRSLGCEQPSIEQKFRAQLQAAKEGSVEEIQAPGLLIGGSFGEGKSHLLEYLQHIAIEENFVCSKVVISKETLCMILSSYIAMRLRRQWCPANVAQHYRRSHQD